MAFRGLFGRKMFGNSSERDETMYPGGGVYGGGPGQQDDLAGRFAAAQQPEKQGFFQSDRGRNAIGTFADTLIKLRTGQDPGIMRNMQHRQNREFVEAQYEKKRQADYQDFMAKEAYKRQHPEQTAFAKDLSAAGIDPASEQGRGLYQQYVTNKAVAPPLVQRNPDGTTTLYERGMIPRGQGLQPGTVEDGFRFKGGDPADKNNWEPVQGGSGGNVTGGF